MVYRTRHYYKKDFFSSGGWIDSLWSRSYHAPSFPWRHHSIASQPTTNQSDVDYLFSGRRCGHSCPVFHVSNDDTLSCLVVRRRRGRSSETEDGLKLKVRSKTIVRGRLIQSNSVGLI